ncbi:ATP-binding protein [Planomonospora corallina]|uniref:histidine kinase n=1 Tax=Planomonospora corallina TaxID=1806052 RepID=A0ABV8IEU5_9ACTN
MTGIVIPADEVERLVELDEFGAFDVLVEPVHQAIAELAAHVCRTPIALVNLVGRDRQYFKGHTGTSAEHMDRRVAFCPHTLDVRALVEVPDALADPAFRDDPAVAGEPYVRFYAGAPMISSRGRALGVVCVFDHRPRQLAPDQHRALVTLAACATAVLELGYRLRQADEVIHRLHDVNELKHQFLRSVNHELRTPLASIRSSLQLIQDGGLDAAAERHFLDMIERNSDRLLALLDELLLMASLNAGTAVFRPQTCDLTALAHELADAVAPRLREGRHTLAVHAPGPVPAWGEAARLRHALRHLLDNAIKFTPAGGRITLTVTDDPVPAVEVADTGVGIAPDDLAHVFDDFFRAAHAEAQAIGGTGVGLPIVKKIMDMHGGSVRIDSRPGRGTRVRLTLPALPQPHVPGGRP